MGKTLVFLSLFFVSYSALAECLDRVYTAEHLKKYPKQEIRSILMSLGEVNYNYNDSTGENNITGQVHLSIRMVRNNKPLIVETSMKCENMIDGFLFNPYQEEMSVDTYRCNNMKWKRLKNNEYAVTVTLDPKTVLKNVQTGENLTLASGDNEFRLKMDSQKGGLACESVLYQPLKVNTVRLWSDVILQAVRYDLARPTVTSRNLFHLSVLLWDLYASFDSKLKPYLLTEKVSQKNIADLKNARDQAISYAAYTFIKERYKLAPGNQNDVHPNNYEMGVGDEKPDLFINSMLDHVQWQLGNNPQLTKSNTSDFDAIAFGIASANKLLAFYKEDGSRESFNYAGEADYKIKNNYGFLDVMQSGVKTPVEVSQTDDGSDYVTILGEEFADNYDINYWLPLHIPGSMDQNGVEVDSPQAPLTLFWGNLPTFSDLSSYKSFDKEGVYFDDEVEVLNFNDNREEFIKANLAVVEMSQSLNPFDLVALKQDFDGDGQYDQNKGSQLVDISPAGMGNNNFASNDGSGYSLNPVTQKPYAPQKIKTADFYRSLAEFWADGPRSETPPGHWNVIANSVVDEMVKNKIPFQWMGSGPKLDREQFELMLHVTLNGALYDAGIVAWGLKGHYQGSRPLTVLRKLSAMAEKDPAFGKYLESLSSHVKMVTYEQIEWEVPTAMDLVQYLLSDISSDESPKMTKKKVTKLAIKGYRGPGYFGEIPNYRNLSFNIRDSDSKKEELFYLENSEAAGAGWILAENWLPYQQQTFVTPPFPGLISGHSTFSRAAAEVLAAATGSSFFPGGLGTYPAPALVFENAIEPFDFQWATYFDAADQSGISRIYGGIHASFDDIPGRKIGAQIGRSAVKKANAIFK